MGKRTLHSVAIYIRARRFSTGCFMLILALAACAGQMKTPDVATPAGNQRPQWQQQMDLARRLAADGSAYVMVVRPLKEEGTGKGGVYVFYNNPSPFCYTYMIPGEWVRARESDAYQSKDGKAFVDVLFLLPDELKNFEGTTLVERAGNLISREYEKGLGQRLPSAELKQFEPAEFASWRWQAAQVIHKERLIVFPTKIIVDIRPDAVVMITVHGTEDDDGLARRIIETLKTTSDSQCYWPILESLLKIATGEK
jgi:hypothetical protein